jgi:hypothetical protein
MPYLPVEFDALEKCQHIARATDARPGDVLFGLALTWRDTFRERRDRWGIDHLRAFFGTKIDDFLPLLVAFGFFEGGGDEYRVKGASRLLRARDAQRAAAEQTNAKKAVKRTVDRPVKRRSSVRLTVRSDDALTANSNQHTAEEDPAEAAGRPSWVTPYLERYGEALNERRSERGYPPLSGALLHEERDIKALCQYLKKLKDRPTVEAFGFRVDQWLADAWQTDNGLTRLRDFPAWHQRQVRKSKPVGKSDADRAMEEA